MSAASFFATKLARALFSCPSRIFGSSLTKRAGSTPPSMAAWMCLRLRGSDFFPAILIRQSRAKFAFMTTCERTPGSGRG